MPARPGPPPEAGIVVLIVNVAIGDIATYPGKRKLVLPGFAEAAAAAHAIHGRVHPGTALHFEYSTNERRRGAHPPRDR